jgi:hypothetical protein
MIRNLKLQNWKGRTASYEFNAGNLILGKNFTGKSAIDLAVRRVLLGYVPGMSDTLATLKKLASDHPLTIDCEVNGRSLGLTMEKVKTGVKVTRDDHMGAELDERSRIMLDPSLFFGLSDNARVSKACALVQSADMKPAAIAQAIIAELGEGRKEVAEAFRLEVVNRVTTVNDLLGQAEDWWKARRKLVNEEKARMQKTVEGVADMSNGETVLPPRNEVEAQKRATAERIQSLNGQIAVAREGVAHQQMRQKTIDRLTAATQGRAGIVADLMTNEGHAKIMAEEIEVLLAKKNAAQRAVDSASQTAAHAEHVAKLRQSAQREPELRLNLTALQDALGREEARLEQLRTAYRAAEQALVEAKTEANHATTPEPGAELRTDEFAGEPGKEYLIRATASVGPDGEMTDIRVTEWQELTTPDPEAIEAAQMAAYEAHQAVAVAAEEVDRIRVEMEAESKTLIALRKQRDDIATQLDRCSNAAELLANAGEPRQAGDIDTLRRELAQVVEALNRAKQAALSTQELIRTLRDRLTRIDSAAAELATVNAQQLATVRTPEEVAALEQELQTLKATQPELDATLERIVRAEQDQARIAQAAKQREVVEATYKAFGKVLDLIAQKKQELVATSIEAPLAIANELANGILRGRLAFEEGELGMRVGERFISHVAFSGTESAVAMMGLTAGLAAGSSLKVLMLDELGRLDPDNRIRLLLNLNSLTAAGHIDQWFVIGPTDDVLAQAHPSNWNLITL